MKIKSKFLDCIHPVQNSLRQVLGYILLLLLVTACGNLVGAPPPKSKAAPDKKKMTRYQKLVSENDVIRKENETIKNQLETLKETQKKNSEKFEQQLRNMDETIQLMEKNFDQAPPPMVAIKPPPSVMKKSPAKASLLLEKQTNPPVNQKSMEINNTNSEGSFSTPDGSKAIEPVFLFTPPSIPKKIEQPSSNSSVHSIDQNQNKALPVIENGEETWDDPDLNPPVSPIGLRVISGAKNSYKDSFRVFAKKDYNKAIIMFGDFINQFPNDQDVDNSQFWIGQAYFNQKNYFLSETSFRKVLKNYPHGETRNGYKTADSILMLGRIYFQRSRPIRSRYYFKKVVELFPKSRSAFKARKELESMNSF